MLENILLWKEITLGKYENGDAYRVALDTTHVLYDEEVVKILASSEHTFVSNEQQVGLALVSYDDLFTEAELFDSGSCDLIGRAKEKGLSLCATEVGPALRLTYLDQPEGEDICVMMEGLGEITKTPYGKEGLLFTLSNDGTNLNLKARTKHGYDHMLLFNDPLYIFQIK